MLSSLSGSISTFLRHGTTVEEREERADAPKDFKGATGAPADSVSHPAPHTPEQRSCSASSQRLSPNSLSASGSEIMSGVLSAHPHFSVFRKRGGSGQTSREEDVEDSPSENGRERGGFSMKDLQDDGDEAVETLVTPPNQSPNSSARAPGATAATDGNVSSDSSFHLSLDSGDMPSLNFGEASSLSLSPSNSPRGPSPRSRSTSPSASSYAPRTASPLSAVHTPDQSGNSMSGGVRPIPDSPPQTRTPARQSFSRSSSTSSTSINTLDRSERRSTNKMRSSTNAGPVQRVQFSPLSLCPSPLMNAPPPPPPPPPPFSLDEEALTSLGTPPATVGRGILKLPKTPGTGRSVRFSASTVRRSPLATDSVPLPAGMEVEGEGREYEDEEEGEEEGMEDSPSVAPGGRSLSRFGRARGEVEEGEIEGDEGREEGEEGGGSVIIRQEVLEDEEEERLFPTDELHSSCSFSTLPSTAPFAPAGEDDSSLLISSTLLSRLQAIAPSPDVSLISPPTASAPLPSISVGQATPSSAVQTAKQQQEGKDASLLLFDESNPFLGQSHSHIHSNSHSQLDHVNLAASTTSASSSSSSSTVHLETASTSTSTSVLLIDSSLPLNLVDTSLATINGGGPSFGGESFAQVSYLHHPLGVARPAGGKTRLEEIGEEEEEEVEEQTAEYSAATTILPPSASPATAARTPRPSKSSTSPPSSPHFPQTPSSAARSVRDGEGGSGSPLRASDMSSVAPEGGEEEESNRNTGRRSASPSPPPGYDSLSPPTSSTATFSSPSPTCIAPSPAAASPARSTSSAPATSAAVVGGGENNLSFYRLFMSSRASLRGGSTAAREEWGRLERGEKGSPRDASTSSTSSASARKQGRENVEEEQEDGQQGEEVEQEGVGEESVYWSPRKEGSVEFDVQEEEEEEEEERGIRAVSGGEEDGEEAVIDGLERMRASFLSPIVEVSEPESNANTPFDPSASTTSRRPTSSAPVPPQPSFATALHQSLSVSSATTPAPPATPSRKLSSSRAPSTPLSASKIPRPRNPITPSQNPFLLQLARAPHPAGSTAGAAAQKGAALLSDLFSAQQDQLATSHSQRFILSSLVTNLQNEVEHKEKMVDNLKRQVEQAREEAREVEQLALEWEERFRQATSSSSSISTAPPPSTAETPSASSSRHDRKKIHALEETIQLLADELETRVQEDRAHRHRLEVELDDARADLVQRDREVREGDIRLRYAQGEALRAVEEGRRAREEEGKAKEEMEGLRARWKVEVEEREEAVRLLREELLDLKQQHQGEGSVNNEVDIEKEVARRVAAALEESARETALVKHELVQRDAALASLRESTRQQREEIDRLAQAVQTERQQAELAHSDMVAALEAREEELVRAQEAQVAAQDEADEALARLEAAETERDRMSDTLRAKEDQLAQQVEQNRSALEAMAELETHVQRIAGDLAAKEDELRRAKREMDQQRREAEDVLEKRDRVLAESEKLAGKARRELEGVQKENNRLNDLVGKLRRDSADREVKVTKLKKRVAELEEDVFGLNIALDAKQQEASHWKRQMSTLKHDRERAAAAASSLADSTASAFPSTVSRSTFAPISAASTIRRSTSTLSLATASKAKQHATTPHPTDKTKPAPSRRVSVTARPSSAAISASSATETEDDVEASHDLTLPPADYEKTPSRAPSVGMRKSSSTAVFSSVGAGVPSRKLSSSALSRGRRSSSFEGEAKENALPVQGREGRRREAVLA